jgi:hypothetical protein
MKRRRGQKTKQSPWCQMMGQKKEDLEWDLDDEPLD